jgi:hypothetical protein
MTAAGNILAGGGDTGTALTLARLAEAQNERNWQHNRPDWQMVGPDLYNLNDLGGGQRPAAGQRTAPQSGAVPPQPDYQPDYPPPQQQADAGQPAPTIRGTPKKQTRVVGNKLVDADTGEVIQEYPAQPRPLGATDRKAIRDAKSNDIQLKSTVSALTRAKELNDKIFTGAGAGVRQYLGTKWKDALVPDQIASPGQAQQTEEWRSIMQPEALQAMANSLTGATTDFELRQFVTLLADPETTPQTRKSQIDRMLKLAEEKQLLNADLVREYEENSDIVADPEAAQEGAADPGAEPPEGGQVIERGGKRYWLSDDGTQVLELD